MNLENTLNEVQSFAYNWKHPILASLFFIPAIFSKAIALWVLASLWLLFAIATAWRSTIYKEGFSIKYIASPGMANYFEWNSVENVEMFEQHWKGSTVEELRISLKSGRRLKFFRLGVKNYEKFSSKMCEEFRLYQAST